MTVKAAPRKNPALAAAGRKGAYVTHSRHDGQTVTAAARMAFQRRFEHDVDPDGVLAPAERTRRAAYARKAFYQDLSMKGAAARRKS